MTLTKLLDYLPRGNLLDDETWHKRHLFLLWVLGLHVPALVVFGLWLGYAVPLVLSVLAVPALFVLIASQVRHRRVASVLVTAGLTYCSVVIVAFSKGTIEAHFHFFIIVGFIALYQDWVPFLWNIVFTTVSHGVGSAWQAGLIFNHLPAQNNPWLWSVIHGVSVLAACIGVVVFWRETENQQQKTLTLRTELANAEITQRKFTSELLVNLARRNQSMLYRQLGIINQLEEKERDPDALAELFRLDHLATRIRRNAESLLVLSGEEPTRVWSEPVRLIDVVRAAIAETEDLDRVAFAVDERMEVLGHLVTDLTHVLAELTENAVRFSPPEANVTIRTRPYMRKPGAAVLTVEDWGVGMRPEDMAAANEILANPRDVDLSVSKRLGLHVVARLAARHNIQVTLTATPGCGVTAAVVLPAELFAEGPRVAGDGHGAPHGNGASHGNGRAQAEASTATARQATSAGPPPAPEADIPMPRRAPAAGDTRSRRSPSGPPASSQREYGYYDPAPPGHAPGTNGNGGAPSNGGAASDNGSRGNGSPNGRTASNGTAAHGTGSSSTATPNGTASHGTASHGAASNGGVADDDTPTGNARTSSNGHRGAHAAHTGSWDTRSDEWTGWWTPTRLPTVDADSWEETEPVYAKAERPGQDPHQGWTPPQGTTPALPAGSSATRRSDANNGPVITGRTANGDGYGSRPNERDTSGTGYGNGSAQADGGSVLDPRLTRRVPQRNLAPELRRDMTPQDAVIPEPAAPPDAERARDALSRFQASRQAAQHDVEEGAGREHGRSRP